MVAERGRGRGYCVDSVIKMKEGDLIVEIDGQHTIDNESAWCSLRPRAFEAGMRSPAPQGLALANLILSLRGLGGPCESGAEEAEFELLLRVIC